jgi:hypothetical protein
MKTLKARLSCAATALLLFGVGAQAQNPQPRLTLSWEPLDRLTSQSPNNLPEMRHFVGMV